MRKRIRRIGPAESEVEVQTIPGRDAERDVLSPPDLVNSRHPVGPYRQLFFPKHRARIFVIGAYFVIGSRRDEYQSSCGDNRAAARIAGPSVRMPFFFETQNTSVRDL